MISSSGISTSNSVVCTIVKLLNTIVSILNCNRMYIEAISASSCVRHSS